LCHGSTRHGGEGSGSDQDSDHTRDLNQPCQRSTTNIEEYSHGEEEKEEEREIEDVSMEARASYWGRAP